MSPEIQPLGPVMLDLAGLVVSEEDREVLRHPAVGGVILFARNYESPEQLQELTRSINRLRRPGLLIAVDHEGGRVQRFRTGFSNIPAMQSLGEWWDRDPAGARAEASRLGRLIAEELGARGVDFSFTPVLDLDYGCSEVIGDRAFHRQPAVVAALASALSAGLRSGGMAAVAKHFPGHGHVAADSHHALPVDDRGFDTIAAEDLVPFAALAAAGIEGIMPAHVVYARCDAQPAGYSKFWLQEILRGRLGYQGLIFSDDLGMVGAHTAGDIVERARLALNAGCDMVLVCNDRPAAIELLERGRLGPAPGFAGRADRLRHRAG